MSRFGFILALATFFMATAPASALDPAGEGRRAWLKYNCYGCHGTNGKGGMGPNLQTADANKIWAAINGSGRSTGMRDYKNILTYLNASNIATYLSTVGTAKEPKWFNWWNR